MNAALSVVVSLLLLACVRADQPAAWRELADSSPSDAETRNDQQYRLPQTVIPLAYDVQLSLFFNENVARPYSYNGRVQIIIQAMEENVTQIVLHSNVERVTGMTLRDAGGSLVPVSPQQPFLLEPQFHFLRINLQQPLLTSANYTLNIEYTKLMNEGPMNRGIWRGWYTDANNTDRVYATTHFQPYNARQAFPCWDEPGFKAQFTLHLQVPAAYRGVYSNTALRSIRFLPDSRLEYNFQSTPRMSSYLVTFLVSESFQVIAQDASFTPPVRIIGRSNTVGLGDHALNLAVAMTEFFDQYFEILYSSLHPFFNNDHISSPDWASAGTENWGMVSYRELYMIILPGETTISVEHYAATLVSHELAHKWFGNLITCRWWSNTWINEGFASYFGYIATHERFPEYEFPDHFNARYLQNSLSFDSGVNSVALNHDVSTPAQVTGHFGTISYSKGAAFLRMTADIITPATFRKACQYFLRDNAYEPTDPQDLRSAFERAIAEDESVMIYGGFNFTQYYDMWVNEPGYPVLQVQVNYVTGMITLTQERFFLSATATPTDQIYPIPISFSTRGNPDFSNLRPRLVMSGRTEYVTKPVGEEWVIFNNQQRGHYRVNYDETGWNLIAQALLDEPETIHYLNRAQIVNDLFEFMRSGRVTYDFGFSVLRFLREETNYHVWDSAITGFNWIRNRFRHHASAQAQFDSFVLSYMERVIEEAGFEVAAGESKTLSMRRQDVLHFACLLGHEECIQQSREGFDLLRNNNTVHPYLRRHVYVAGVRDGDAADWEFLLQRLAGSDVANDRLEMLRALAATQDPALLTRYLELTLTRAVRSHDKATSFNYALLGGRAGAPVALQFIMQRINDIRREYVEEAPPNPVHTVLSNLAAYLEEPELAEYENWLRSSQTHIPQYNSALAAISTARSNIAWAVANADTILSAARGSAAALFSSATLLIAMTLFAAAA